MEDRRTKKKKKVGSSQAATSGSIQLACISLPRISVPAR